MEKQPLRIGKISSVNAKDGTAKVTYEDKDDSTTAYIPFLAWCFWVPKIGDQVLVGNLSSGGGRAVIIGPFWYEGHRPNQGRDGLYRQELTNSIGGDSVEYDAAAGAMTIRAGGCTLTLQGGKATLDAPGGVEVSSSVAVATEVTAGGISLTKHTHMGVHGGTSGPL